MASFTERYHELTKYNPNTIDRLGPVHWESQPSTFKSISSKEKIDLLSHLQSLINTLDQSSSPNPNPSLASSPNPSLKPGLETIASLLFFTLGLTARYLDQAGQDFFLRASPSAGGLYPTEIYVAVRNQPDLADGLYHYHSLKSALIPVWQGSFWADLNHYFLGQKSIEAADTLFLFTGLYGRSAWRYKERAYRRILLDTGHAVGNLVAACNHFHLDTALLGGFVDEGLEELLFLTHKEEFPLLAVAIGPNGTIPQPIGQYPSCSPEKAYEILLANQANQANQSQLANSSNSQVTDPMQVQQNFCERIRHDEMVRPPVISVTTPFFSSSSTSSSAPSASTSPISQPISILKTILNRRSCRSFTGKPITLAQLKANLSFAFSNSSSISLSNSTSNSSISSPTDPSESPPSLPQTTSPLNQLAPNQMQFHIVALNVIGLEAGVYEFDPIHQNLTLKRGGDFSSQSLFMCLGQELASDCAFALVYTSDLAALTEAYGDRGYRYACLDAGQIGERIQLYAIHQNLGSSGIGGYYDDEVNDLLELPLSHGILYLTVVGVPDEN